LILLVARILLAVVFAVAAVGKVGNRSRTVETLVEFGVPERLRAPTATALPVAELAIAVALLPASTAAWAALAAALLLASFSVAVARVLARGQAVDCNCFGSLGPSRITRWTAARNGLLLLVAATVAVIGQSEPGPSALGWIGDLDTAGLAALGAGVAIALGALNFAFFWQLMRQNGRLLAELQALEDGSAPKLGPQPGDMAPAFELPALGGGSLSLEQLLGADRGLAVLVIDPGCAACDPLLPEVGRLQHDPATPSPLVLISRGDLGANAAKAEEHDLEPVLLEEGFEVSRALGINGAPGLVQLDPEGRFIDKPAMGAERVSEALAILGSRDPADIALTVHQGGS
jgi:hypothetical protein